MILTEVFRRVTNEGPAISSELPVLIGSQLRQLVREVALGDFLGAGASGSKVYKGNWRGSVVALKLTVSPDVAALRLSTREALLSRSLSHPQLVQTYAIHVCPLTQEDLMLPLNTTTTTNVNNNIKNRTQQQQQTKATDRQQPHPSMAAPDALDDSGAAGGAATTSDGQQQQGEEAAVCGWRDGVDDGDGDGDDDDDDDGGLSSCSEDGDSDAAHLVDSFLLRSSPEELVTSEEASGLDMSSETRETGNDSDGAASCSRSHSPLDWLLLGSCSTRPGEGPLASLSSPCVLGRRSVTAADAQSAAGAVSCPAGAAALRVVLSLTDSGAQPSATEAQPDDPQTPAQPPQPSPPQQQQQQTHAVQGRKREKEATVNNTIAQPAINVVLTANRSPNGSHGGDGRSCHRATASTASSASRSATAASVSATAAGRFLQELYIMGAVPGRYLTVVLMEYCDRGTLLDWIQQRSAGCGDGGANGSGGGSCGPGRGAASGECQMHSSSRLQRLHHRYYRQQQQQQQLCSVSRPPPSLLSRSCLLPCASPSLHLSTNHSPHAEPASASRELDTMLQQCHSDGAEPVAAAAARQGVRGRSRSGGRSGRDGTGGVGGSGSGSTGGVAALAGDLELLRNALEIAQGMAHLHTLGLAHGDLKPANVLLRSIVNDEPAGARRDSACAAAGGAILAGLDPWFGAAGSAGNTAAEARRSRRHSQQHSRRPTGHTQDGLARGYCCKVADFGLTSHAVSLLQPDDPAAAVPLSGHLGSPAYMAPEVAAGAPLDKPADVYSYGVLLWHMLSGVPPYAALRPAQILVGLASGELSLEWPTGHCCAEPTLRKIGAAATNQDPTARPTFDQIVRALLKTTERKAARWAAAESRAAKATDRSRERKDTHNCAEGRQVRAAAGAPASSRVEPTSAAAGVTLLPSRCASSAPAVTAIAPVAAAVAATAASFGSRGAGTRTTASVSMPAAATGGVRTSASSALRAVLASGLPRQPQNSWPLQGRQRGTATMGGGGGGGSNGGAGTGAGGAWRPSEQWGRWERPSGSGRNGFEPAAPAWQHATASPESSAFCIIRPEAFLLGPYCSATGALAGTGTGAAPAAAANSAPATAAAASAAFED